VDTRFSITENRNLSRKRYTNEFKKEAVRYLVIEGESVVSASKRLGVSANQLYKWKSLYLSECSADSKTKPDFKEVVAENERLRKELRRAERANEFLKKTVGYFAKDEL